MPSAMTVVRISRSDLAAAARHHPPGYLERVLSIAQRADQDSVYVENSAFAVLLDQYRRPGPGSELKKLLSAVGIKSSPNCSCNAKARQMDAWGPEECERRMDEIVGWLREQARVRRLPFSGFAAKKLVQMAISRARKLAAKRPPERHKPQ